MNEGVAGLAVGVACVVASALYGAWVTYAGNRRRWLYAYRSELRRCAWSQEYQDRWVTSWTVNAARWGWDSSRLEAQLMETRRAFPGMAEAHARAVAHADAGPHTRRPRRIEP